MRLEIVIVGEPVSRRPTTGWCGRISARTLMDWLGHSNLETTLGYLKDCGRPF